MESALFEGVPREDVGDAFNDIDELLERQNNVFSIDNLAFAKRYEDGVGVLRLEWTGLGVGIGHGRKHVAIFQRELGFRWVNWQRSLEGFRREALPFRNPVGWGREEKIDDDVFKGRAYRNDGAMFIEDIEIVKIAERGECPSSVWLQSSYHLDVLGTDVGELVRDLAFKRRFGGTDWEVSCADFCSAGAAVVDGERGGEVVQAGAKVMDDITDHAGEMFGYGLPDPEFVMFVSGVRVTLSANQIWLGVQEGSNLRFKLSKVAFGPVDLYPDRL